LEQNPKLREILTKAGLESRDWTIPETELPDSEFDIIISMAFLEHLPTWIAAFELLLECKRLLKAGGSIVVIAPNAPAAGRAFWNDYKHAWYVSKDRLQDMALDVGLLFAESRYTLGWISMSKNPMVLVARFIARSMVTILNFPWLLRGLDSLGLGRLVRKAHKTLFEQVLVRLTKSVQDSESGSRKSL
jgi:SAM-dependent methyltransferase